MPAGIAVLRKILAGYRSSQEALLPVLPAGIAAADARAKKTPTTKRTHMDDIILLVIAVLPAIALMVFIYTHDKTEKEPLGLLIKLAVAGAVSTFPIAIAEFIVDDALLSTLVETSLAYVVISNFIGVALVEEAGKLITTKLVSWKNRAFNYTFDGVVYAVFVSLGFALLENVMYVFTNETFAEALSVGISRALLSIPLHCFCGVFMGVFYAEAKKQSLLGNQAQKKKCLFYALAVPTVLHGFYDFCLSVDFVFIDTLFIAFVIAMYVVSFKYVKKALRNDQPQPQVQVWTQGQVQPQAAPAAWGQQPGYGQVQPQAQAAPAAWPSPSPYVSSQGAAPSNATYSGTTSPNAAPSNATYPNAASTSTYPRATSPQWICRACGTTNNGNFCTNCGTKK